MQKQIERPIRWSGLKNPDYDLCLKRAEGYWDIIHGVDGWVIYSPIQVNGSHFEAEMGRFRLVLKDGTRDEAQAVAEKAIRALIK